MIRAIGVSHTACKDEFRQIFDLTAGVYYNLYIYILGGGGYRGFPSCGPCGFGSLAIIIAR